MGIDIYTFVEVQYGDKEDEYEPFSGDFDIRPFNVGPFFIWRDPMLWDALGNGHSDAMDAEYRALWPKALYAPRGLPPHISFGVFNEFYLWVTNDENAHLPPEGPYRQVPRQEADAWVKRGIARIRPHPEPYAVLSGHLIPGKDYDVEYRPTIVTNPAWRNASWLTLKEIREALDHFRAHLARRGIPDDLNGNAGFKAVLEAMASLERNVGDGRTRLVFWFD